MDRNNVDNTADVISERQEDAKKEDKVVKNVIPGTNRMILM